MGLFWGKKKVTIAVTFVNAVDESVIGRGDMPPDNLPDSFEISTQMSIADDQWQVEQAIPAKKEEFVKSGKLTLKMLKIEMIDPREIRFTLPTIANVLPSLVMDSPLYSDFSLTLREDDWLQVEVLGGDIAPYINQELEAIKDIWQNQAHQGEGYVYFDKLHVRKEASQANLSLSLAQLIGALPVMEKGNIKFDRQAGTVAGGFALKTDGAMLYGTAEDGQVSTLGVVLDGDEGQVLIKAMRALSLVVVDWCAAEVLTD